MILLCACVSINITLTVFLFFACGSNFKKQLIINEHFMKYSDKILNRVEKLEQSQHDRP